jgi:hypothetical protein
VVVKLCEAVKRVSERALCSGQQTSYNRYSVSELAYYLAPNLGYHAPDAQTRLAPAFFCPG